MQYDISIISLNLKKDIIKYSFNISDVFGVDSDTLSFGIVSDTIVT